MIRMFDGLLNAKIAKNDFEGVNNIEKKLIDLLIDESHGFSNEERLDHIKSATFAVSLCLQSIE